MRRQIGWFAVGGVALAAVAAGAVVYAAGPLATLRQAVEPPRPLPSSLPNVTAAPVESAPLVLIGPALPGADSMSAVAAPQEPVFSPWCGARSGPAPVLPHSVRREDVEPNEPALANPKPVEPPAVELAPVDAAAFDTATIDTAPIDTAPSDLPPMNVEPIQIGPAPPVPFTVEPIATADLLAPDVPTVAVEPALPQVAAEETQAEEPVTIERLPAQIAGEGVEYADDPTFRKPLSAIRVNVLATEGALPPNAAAALYAGAAADTVVPRAEHDTLFFWQATNLRHRPLYFQQDYLERDGRSFGLAQPIVSGVQFFGSVPLLPYRMVRQPPCRCIYTLGESRPDGYGGRRGTR